MIDVDRVLRHCGATVHNTLAAAIASPNRADRCVCPHAVSLAGEVKPNIYRRVGVPYRILDECPAPAHNTVPAYYRRDGRGCRCPGALILREEFLKSQAGRKKRERGGTASPGGRLGVAVIAQSTYSIPSLLKEMMAGACRKRENLAIVDMGFSYSAKDRMHAKRLCWNDCPIGAFEACARYVRQEPAPGEWDGVYAGMDAEDRRVSARVDAAA